MIDLLDPRPVYFEALSIAGPATTLRTFNTSRRTELRAQSASRPASGSRFNVSETHLVRLLWMEQVCINQPDKGELARQISITGRRAERVIVWLGGSDTDVERLVDTVNEALIPYQEPSEVDLRDESARVRLSKVSVNGLPRGEVN